MLILAMTSGELSTVEVVVPTVDIQERFYLLFIPGNQLKSSNAVLGTFLSDTKINSR